MKFVKLSANEIFLIRDKGVFSTHARLTDKGKLFLNPPRHKLPTALKLTSSHTFHLRQPTVSLQYTISFPKNISLASALR